MRHTRATERIARACAHPDVSRLLQQLEVRPQVCLCLAFVRECGELLQRRRVSLHKLAVAGRLWMRRVQVRRRLRRAHGRERPRW